MSASKSPQGPVAALGQAPVRPGRILIVSNRLPVTAQVDREEIRLQPSDGGLATGLRSVHQYHEGLWIGWSGLTDRISLVAERAISCRLRDLGASGVPLSEQEVAGYYHGYSNSALWPVLHDRLRQPQANPGDWELYRTVNQRYADVVSRHFQAGDRIWIHDFHLMLLPRLIRDRCPGARIGFFLHTPFPPAQSFATLPHARELVDGMLGANQIGFHVRDYARNFQSAVQLLLGYSPGGDEGAESNWPGVFACPMGIDVPFFTAWTRKPEVIAQAARIRRDGKGPLFVGIDRLDYTKGILQRLQAFEQLLELEPDLRGRARLIQVAVPSRESACGYAETREAVEALVARINQRYSGWWTPVEYQYAKLDTATLVALYRAADVMLVTPLCDGMNLVAKEFVASRDDEEGVLVLSSRAGAAAELSAAVLTDPWKPNDLLRAYRVALEMRAAERRVRMRHLRTTVQDQDVFHWSKCCLERLNSSDTQRLVPQLNPRTLGIGG